MKNKNLSELTIDEKRVLLKKMMAEKQAQTAPKSSFARDAVKGLEMQEALLTSMGVANPYFHTVESVSRDTVIIHGEEYINFSGYNYLGCSGDDYVNDYVINIVKKFGTSSSASRVASGDKNLHLQLENMIANKLGVQAALCFVGGYTTNVSTIGHIMTQGDLILHDSLAHRSLIVGATLSGARRMSFSHDNLEELDEKCRDHRSEHAKCLILIEGVYSMDGDIPNLPKYIELKKKYDCMLMVDEAHSAGVLGNTGEGIREHFDVDGKDVDIWMGTLSKAYASCGGYIAGTNDLIKYLKYTAPGFVYSVGMPPPSVAAAIASMELIAKEPERVSKLHAISDLFREESKKYGLNIGLSADSAVIPIITGKSTYSLYLADRLYKEHINVQPIFYPTVEEGAARLRFFVSCLHSEEQIKHTVKKTAEIFEDIKQDKSLLQEFPEILY